MGSTGMKSAGRPRSDARDARPPNLSNAPAWARIVAMVRILCMLIVVAIGLAHRDTHLRLKLHLGRSGE